jgi:hypothetical protein
MQTGPYRTSAEVIATDNNLLAGASIDIHAPGNTVWTAMKNASLSPHLPGR